MAHPPWDALKKLKYSRTTKIWKSMKKLKKLKHHIHWLDTLNQFRIRVTYIPAKNNKLSDILSRPAGSDVSKNP
jgi:hypothetical protein